MPFIRFSVFKRLAYYFKLVAIILLLGKIMPTYSRYMEKGLVCIIIMVLFNHQPFSYAKCIKLNMRSSCNIYLVLDAKCMFFMCLYTLKSLRLLYLICLRVLYNNCY